MKHRMVDNDEARLLQLVGRASGPVVTRHWAHMVLLAATGMDVAMIAEVSFIRADFGPRRAAQLQRRRIRLAALKYAGGCPVKFTD